MNVLKLFLRKGFLNKNKTKQMTSSLISELTSFYTHFLMFDVNTSNIIRQRVLSDIQPLRCKLRHCSLRKHPFLLALLAAGDVPTRETSPAAKSDEKRMFSQAKTLKHRLLCFLD